MDGKRRDRLDRMLAVIHSLHGHTLRALAESERRDRIADQASKLSDEDHEAYEAMLHAMKPREDRKD